MGMLGGSCPVSGRFSDALSGSRTLATTTRLNHTADMAASPLLSPGR
jgi:hypothetical protein